MPDIEVTFRGTYEVEDGDIVAVFYNGRRKSTQIGGSPPDVLAKQLLREMVRDPEGKGSVEVSAPAQSSGGPPGSWSSPEKK
jgi:hypothetical protein